MSTSIRSIVHNVRVFAIVVILAGCQSSWPDDDQVRVTLKNESHQEVKRITLTHREGRVDQEGPIRMKEEVTVFFRSPSENAYHVDIELANGKTLKSRGLYVERGYNTTETIYDDSVKSAYEQY